MDRRFGNLGAFAAPLAGRIAAIAALAIALGTGTAAPASAVETVRFKYRDRVIDLPAATALDFIETGAQSSDLVAFFDAIPFDAEEIRELLRSEVVVEPASIARLLDRSLSQFVLFQFGKVMGDPLYRPDNDNLRETLLSAARDDSRVALWEIAAGYPGSTVRLDLPRLRRAYADLASLSNTLDYALEAAPVFLQELVCDCPLPADLERAAPDFTRDAPTPETP